MATDLRRRSGTCLLLASLALPACHDVLGPTSLDENWRAYDGPHITLFVRPDSFAEQNAARLIEVFEDQYAATHRVFSLNYGSRVRGYAYSSAGDAGFTSNYAGRGYPETESFRFVAVPPLGGNLYGLMSHEANHVLLINGLGRHGTSAMGEGLATAVLSETFHSNGRHWLFPWTRSHRAQLPPLARIFDDGQWHDFPAETSYNTSASFLAWLLDTFGADRLRQVYGASSSELPGRINAVYGRSLDSLEADWLRFCDMWVGSSG